MNRGIEIVKKTGAGLIIAVLTLLMAVTFVSRQSVMETLSLLAGSNKIGSFRGEEISGRLLSLVDYECQNRYRSYGNVPDFILDSCVAGELQQLYVLPAIGKEIGIGVSEQSVLKDLLADVKRSFEYQNQSMEKDDQLSVEDLYRRELQRIPMDIRLRLATTQQVVGSLNTFPYPANLVQSDSLAGRASMRLRMVRFSNADLLRGLDGKIQVTDEMVQKRYEAEQKETTEKEKKPLESVKETLRTRIKSEMKQKLLADLKEQLSRLKKPISIDEVSRITGVAPVALGDVTLKGLRSIKVPGSDPVNLAGPDFLLELKASSSPMGIGPIQDGDRTAYVEVADLKLPAAPMSPDEERQLQTESERYTAAYILDDMIRYEAKEGKFNLKKIKR